MIPFLSAPRSADLAGPAAGAGDAIDPARLFLWLALPIYALFAVLTPPFHTPDEHQHVFRAWQIASGDLVGEKAGSAAGGYLPPALSEAARRELGTVEPHALKRLHEPRTIQEALARSTPVDTAAQPRFTNFFGAIVYSPASYLPQIGAVWVGMTLSWSVESIILLGRLFNALVAALLFFFAIRLTPVGRLGFLWVGLLPMTAACAASFGQDGLQIGGAALLTALALRVRADGRWRRRDIATLAGVGIVITLAKFLYLPMLALAAFPKPAGVPWRSWLAPMAGAGLSAALIVAAWLFTIAPTLVDMRLGVPPAGERLAAMAGAPLELAGLLARTWIGHGPAILDSLFIFGWLSIGPVFEASLFSLIALGVVLITGDQSSKMIQPLQRLWFLFVTLSVALLLSLALLLTYTPAGAPTIEGIQGRYLIPLLPAIIVALVRTRALPPRLPEIAVATLMILANAAVLASIWSVFYH